MHEDNLLAWWNDLILYGNVYQNYTWQAIFSVHASQIGQAIFSDFQYLSQKYTDSTSCFSIYEQETGYTFSSDENTLLPILLKNKELTSLWLCNLGLRHLKPLQDFTNVKQLNISNNPIGDLKHLTKLTALQVLKAKNSCLKDLSTLRVLTNLQHLELSSDWFSNTANLIRDITPLYELHNLQEVLLIDSLVKNTHIELFRKKHPMCLLITHLIK